MTGRGRSFCTYCGNEWETAGPEIHRPECMYMIVEGVLLARKLGYNERPKEEQEAIKEARMEKLRKKVSHLVFGVPGNSPYKTTHYENDHNCFKVVRRMRELGFFCELQDRQVYYMSYSEPFASFHNRDMGVKASAIGYGQEYCTGEMICEAAVEAIEKLIEKKSTTSSQPTKN